MPAELEGVLLIPGCEVSTQSGHITGLFLERPLDLKKLRRDGLPTQPSTKGSTFKGPFHLPRALIMCDAMLGQLLES